MHIKLIKYAEQQNLNGTYFIKSKIFNVFLFAISEKTKHFLTPSTVFSRCIKACHRGNKIHSWPVTVNLSRSNCVRNICIFFRNMLKSKKATQIEIVIFKNHGSTRRQSMNEMSCYTCSRRTCTGCQAWDMSREVPKYIDKESINGEVKIQTNSII